jgi:inactivated superfamily I helicase
MVCDKKNNKFNNLKEMYICSLKAFNEISVEHLSNMIFNDKRKYAAEIDFCKKVAKKILDYLGRKGMSIDDENKEKLNTYAGYDPHLPAALEPVEYKQQDESTLKLEANVYHLLPPGGFQIGNSCGIHTIYNLVSVMEQNNDSFENFIRPQFKKLKKKNKESFPNDDLNNIHDKIKKQRELQINEIESKFPNINHETLEYLFKRIEITQYSLMMTMNSIRRKRFSMSL